MYRFLFYVVTGVTLAAVISVAQDTAPGNDAPKKAAATGMSVEELARETEAACTASAKDKATPELVMQKVDAACKLVEKEGKAALSKFKGKDSEFIFAGTYIFIIDMEGTTLLQPIKYKLEGTSSIGMKDSKGKRFFVEFIDIAKTKGSGWSEYWWPRPGEKEGSLKTSYVKKATCDGKDVVVGCGVYGVTKDEIDKAMKAAK